MSRKFLGLIFFLIVHQSHAQTLMVPNGWRYPNKSDLKDDWKNFQKEIPEPYVVKSDFNGDGVIDESWILIRRDGKGWGLFVFLSREDKKYKTITLYETREEDDEPQWMGIVTAKPGTYKTACGKGYFDCAPGEPEALKLKNPGIDFFKYESANSYFYWDGKKREFVRTWMSD